MDKVREEVRDKVWDEDRDEVWREVWGTTESARLERSVFSPGEIWEVLCVLIDSGEELPHHDRHLLGMGGVSGQVVELVWIVL